MINTTAIVISYNSAIEIAACIDSLLSQQGVDLDVIVVDNASADSSLDVIKSYGDKVTLIESDENLGFIRACNLAFKEVVAPYVLFFNPDAYFVDPDALKSMLDIFKAQPGIGMVAPKILDESREHETLPRYTYPGQKHVKRSFADLPGKITWVLGACMLIPSDIFRKLGCFDDALFMYGDDVDFGLRLREAGYRIEHLNTVLVVHVGGASEKHAASYDKTMRKQKALHHFYRQHYSKQDAACLAFREMRRAKWRMFIYRLAGVFSKNKRARYGHYRAVYDSSKIFLDAMNL